MLTAAEARARSNETPSDSIQRIKQDTAVEVEKIAHRIEVICHSGRKHINVTCKGRADFGFDLFYDLYRSYLLTPFQKAGYQIYFCAGILDLWWN